MLRHDLGDDLVLALQLFLQPRQLPLRLAGDARTGGLGKSGRTVFKEGLLPLVKLRRNNLVLLAHLRDRDFLQQVEPQYIHLVFGAEVPPTALLAILFIVAHVLFLVRKSTLAQPRKSVIPIEAEQNNPAQKQHDNEFSGPKKGNSSHHWISYSVGYVIKTPCVIQSRFRIAGVSKKSAASLAFKDNAKLSDNSRPATVLASCSRSVGTLWIDSVTGVSLNSFQS